MTSRNEITWDKLISKPQTKEYQDNYDNIFRKKKVEDLTEESIEKLFVPGWNNCDVSDIVPENWIRL